MEKVILVRPLISVKTEESYVSSFLKVGYYFIEKFPLFFAKMSKEKSDSFEIELSSKIYNHPLACVDGNKDDAFRISVCNTMLTGRSSDKFDAHISLEIVNNPSIGIAFMHKMAWGENQADIYFYDHSQKDIKMPGEKEVNYDPSVLNKKARSFFIENIGFASERSTTIEKGLDVIEKILEKMESLEH